MKKNILQLFIVLILICENTFAQQAPHSSYSTTCDSALYQHKIISVVTGIPLSYAWSRDAVTGISNASATGNSNIISEYLHNTTTVPINVKYVLQTTMQNPNACTQQDTLIVTVYPSAKINSVQPSAICDSTIFNYTITSLTPGSSFVWQRVGNPDIAEQVTTGNTATINEVLYNRSAFTTVVKYAIINTASGCTNPKADTVYINVYPFAKINSAQPSAICDSTTFNYTITSLTPGSSFVWQRVGNPDIIEQATTGNTAIINEVLHNTNSLPTVVNYSVITTANGCTNPNADIINLTVNPTPYLISNLNPAICDSTTFTYVPLNYVAGASMVWQRNAVNGILNVEATGSRKIKEVLLNSTGKIVNVPYYITSSAYGCSHSDIVTLTIWPRPYGNIVTMPNDNVNYGTTLAATFVTTDTILYIRYQWDFGDGQQAITSLNPVSHIYYANVDTTISLSALITNRFGCINNFSKPLFLIHDTTLYRSLNTVPSLQNYSIKFLPVPFYTTLYLQYTLNGPPEQAQFIVNDLSGRIVHNSTITLQSGSNTIALPTSFMQSSSNVLYRARVISKTFNYEDKIYKAVQ